MFLPYPVVVLPLSSGSMYSGRMIDDLKFLRTSANSIYNFANKYKVRGHWVIRQYLLIPINTYVILFLFLFLFVRSRSTIQY